MIIDYKNVTLSQDSKVVLQDVDFHVDEGELVYIIGKVGSGKSSLLKTFYKELPLDKADVAVVLGRNLKDIKRKHIPELRREMGIVFQDFQLLHDRTVYKNLRFVLRATGWKRTNDIDSRIDRCLDAVGMKEFKDKMPHELSGGEQQRVVIARAMLNDPKIIIADEPTGNLDPETAHDIVSLLRNITERGTAVVMSTHNLGIIEQFPGIVYQCEGGVVSRLRN